MPRVLLRNFAATAIGLGVAIDALVSKSGAIERHAAVPRAIVETGIALIGTVVAILAYGRYQRTRRGNDLAVVGAVSLLAWAHTLFDTLPDLIAPDHGGLGTNERIEVWGTIVVRSLAAVILILAARRKSEPRPARPALAVVASVLGFAAALALLVGLAPVGENSFDPALSAPARIGVAMQIADAALFFFAARALARRAHEEDDPFLGWLSAGAILGGFAMLTYAIEPAGSTDWLRPGDVLRGATVAMWALGAVAELSFYWRSIADAARREARLGVAIDLHDGLAQELALLATYTQADTSEREDPRWHEELQATAKRALAEARRAIAALAADEPVSFGVDLERTIESILDAGVDLEVVVPARADRNAPDALQRESLVRIVREAVTNAVRHGQARQIHISFDTGPSHVLRVADDGVGFDPDEAARNGRLGIVGMRERAAAMGASLAVHSEPGSGTTVEVEWT